MSYANIHSGGNFVGRLRTTNNKAILVIDSRALEKSTDRYITSDGQNYFSLRFSITDYLNATVTDQFSDLANIDDSSSDFDHRLLLKKFQMEILKNVINWRKISLYEGTSNLGWRKISEGKVQLVGYARKSHNDGGAIKLSLNVESLDNAYVENGSYFLFISRSPLDKVIDGQRAVTTVSSETV